MANGNNRIERNPSTIRRPRLEEVDPSSTLVSLEQQVEGQDNGDNEVSPQEAMLRAANEGRIDLGEPGEETTPEQAVNKASVRRLANEFLPKFVQERRQQFKEEAKELSNYPRALSAANRLFLDLSKYTTSKVMKTKAVVETALHNYFVDEDEQLEARFHPDFMDGDAVGRALEEIFPESPAYRDEFWAGTVAGAAGSLTPNVIIGVATAGLGTGVTIGASALANASFGADFYEQAKAEGASENKALGFALLNMTGTAALETIPVALFARRIDQATGGGIKKVLARGFSGSIEEGATEAVQEMFSNATGQAIYDSSRDIMDGVYEAFGAGALLGAAVNMTLPALMEKAKRADTAEELADAYAAIESVSETAEAMPGETPMSRNDTNDFLNRFVPENKKKSSGPIVEGETGAGVTSTEVDRSSKEFKQAKKKWKRFWTKYLKPGGFKGEDITRREGKLHALIQEQMEEARLNFTKLNRAVLDHYGSDKKSMYDAVNDPDDATSAEIFSQINQVMRKEAEPSILPTAIRGPVMRARGHVDRLSKEMVRMGLVQGEHAETFIKDIGIYLHRSYRHYDQDVEWNEQVIPDDVWNSVIAFMRNRRLAHYKSQHDALPAGEDLAKIRLAAEKDVRKIIKSRDLSSIHRLFKNKDITVNKADRSALMQRQDIPKPIRDLLGEYKDPAINYINTITEQAQLIEKRKYFDEIAKMGRGSLFFTEEEAYARQDWDEMEQGLVDNTGSLLSKEPATRLDGSKPPKLFMHRDLYKSLTFEAGNNDIPGWLVPFYRVTNMAKISKTALSHVTHARNVLGGLGFINANGLFFTDANNISNAWKKATTVMQSYEKLSAKQLEEEWKRYVNLDLTGDSARGDDLAGMLKDLNMSPSQFMDNFNHAKANADGKGLYKTTKSWFKKGSRELIDLYRLEDTFIRVFQFELELARMQDADPNITEQEVADIINDTYPNYSRVNEFIKQLRVNPVLAPFISFPAELIRTQVNTVQLGLEQRKSDNRKIRRIGNQRLAGTLTNYVGLAAVGAISQALIRLDDEEDDALRQFSPPWDRNSIWAYLDASRGKARYINTSYTAPNSYLIDPMFALISGDSDRRIMERFADSFGELFSPLLSEELVFKAGREIISNKQAGGAEVWNPEDTIADKMQKGFLHFWEAIEPGSISSVQRAFEPIIDEKSDKKASDEILGLFGLRISTIDVPRSYGFRIRDFRQSIRDTRRGYNSVKFDEGSTQREQMDALARANERYREIFTEMRQITEAAQTVGVSWIELEKIMKDSGLANKDINAIQDGVFEPFEP